VQNLCRGPRCAADPAGIGAGGVEASSSSKHAGQRATLHHGQLVVHVGKAGVTLVPGGGKRCVGSFAEELYWAVDKAPQSCKGNGAERAPRACVVVLTACQRHGERGSMARGAGRGAKVRSVEGTDEGYVSEYMARAWGQVAMEIPAWLEAVGGVGSKPRLLPLAAGGEARVSDEVSQHDRGVVMAALHKTTKPVAAESVCDFVALHCMTASARPALAEGGERVDTQALAGCILECLVVQAEGGGIGDCVEPHAAKPGGDAVQEGSGLVSGRNAHQLSVAGCVEGAAYECW
jgi:hypothetical protein